MHQISTLNIVGLLLIYGALFGAVGYGLFVWPLLRKIGRLEHKNKSYLEMAGDMLDDHQILCATAPTDRLLASIERSAAA